VAAPTPATFTAGSFPTAANLNSLRDAALWNYGGTSGARPVLRVHVTAALSIPNATETTVLYQNVDEDTEPGGTYDPSTGLWTCATPGFYTFVAFHNWATGASTSGARFLSFLASGTPGRAYSQVYSPISPLTTGPVTLDYKGRFASGQTLKVNCYQSSGGAMSTSSSAGGNTCYLLGNLDSL
jgi:hypothetical protein